MRRKESLTLVPLAVLALCAGLAACQTKSLVPAKPSDAPDYFSTWNIQGYVVNYRGDSTPVVMNERSMFGKGKLENWLGFFPDFREDLIFQMDEAWDVPAGFVRGEDMASARLDTTRFPSFTGAPAERLGKLVKSVRKAGWKGLGGWICAQECQSQADAGDMRAYWGTRLAESQQAGLAYWKVDFGTHENDGAWRNTLTALGHEYAPGLWIEHSYVYDCVETVDAFRTYDVENIIAAPVTIGRVARLLTHKAKPGARGIINCEDEPAVAVGLGCAIGVMRHPLNGPLPNGLQDHVFPPTCRDLKSRLDEVNRALKWHRIAQPFAVAADALFSADSLTDSWILAERETWNPAHKTGDTLVQQAPARISRNMPLPEVSGQGADRPYVLASRYPGGAVCVATVERVIGRRCVQLPVAVSLQLTDPSKPVGVFGNYKELALNYGAALKRVRKVLAQDLAGERPVDITKRVSVSGGRVVIPGEVISEVGLMAATPGDRSAPGLVLRIF